jgi:hypothetical protein
LHWSGRRKDNSTLFLWYIFIIPSKHSKSSPTHNYPSRHHFLNFLPIFIIIKDRIMRQYNSVCPQKFISRLPGRQRFPQFRESMARNCQGPFLHTEIIFSMIWRPLRSYSLVY